MTPSQLLAQIDKRLRKLKDRDAFEAGERTGLEAVRDLIDGATGPQWIDEPIQDGWYWIEHSHVEPLYVVKQDGPWQIPLGDGGTFELLDGRRVAPCTGRPE